MTFADAEYAGKRKQTRKELFLIEMDRVVPWKGLIALIEPHYPKGEGGRPAYPLMAMLRVHLLQNWFGYSDPAMEEALYETTILRQFAGLNLERIPDETTILNFRRLLEKHELAAGILAVINGSGRPQEALYETTILRQFAGLNLERIPDETTILNFRRLLEKHELAAGILAVINGSGRPRPVAAPGHHRRCNADQCAQFDQEQGRQARPGNAPDQEGKPVLFRQCDLKVAWVSVPQVNARRNRLFHHSFPTQTGVAGNSRV
ncbi:transposase [Klebsiella pneumoniae 303K]|nr:transposase [Klebsiella pneumoniae 303K]